jgi:vancomycin resistance protein YoaR
MIKHKKSFWVLIIIQFFLGLCAGMLILFSIKIESIPSFASVGGYSVGEMSFEEARNKLAGHYNELVSKNNLIIEIDNKGYYIAYTDIDVVLDLEETMNRLEKSIPQNALEEFFFNPEALRSIKPAFTYNSSKLLWQCKKIFSPYETEPVSEYYTVSDGSLKLIPQKPGRKVNYSELENVLRDKLFNNPEEPFSVDSRTFPFFAEVAAASLYKELFTKIVSKADIPVEPEFIQKTKDCLQKINGLIYESNQNINLEEILNFQQFSTDVEKDLLNRIATALYQSVLPIKGMEVLHRQSSQRAVPYSEMGLEAIIEDHTGNLVIKNGTECPVMLLAECSESNITIYIAATGELEVGTIQVDKKDETPPPVITSVNPSLGKNETRVISEGAPGYTVYVSRVIGDESEQISCDYYQPVSKIVETGYNPVSTVTK